MIKINLLLYEKKTDTPFFSNQVSLPVVPRKDDLIMFQGKVYRVNEIKLFVNDETILVAAVSLR